MALSEPTISDHQLNYIFFTTSFHPVMSERLLLLELLARPPDKGEDEQGDEREEEGRYFTYYKAEIYIC